MEDNTQQKKKITLPLIAVCLSFLPIVMFSLQATSEINIPLLSLWVILAPIAGCVTGIYLLGQKKASLSLGGKMLALLAIAAPLTVVGAILALFIGVATGNISFM